MAHLLIAGKDAQRVDENRRAIDFYELFGGLPFFAGRRHAGAESGGGNDCYDLHKG